MARDASDAFLAHPATVMEIVVVVVEVVEGKTLRAREVEHHVMTKLSF